MKKTESSTVKEFWRRRAQVSRELSKMTGEEILDFFHKGAENWHKKGQEYREEKARTETTEQAKEA